MAEFADSSPSYKFYYNGTKANIGGTNSKITMNFWASSVSYGEADIDNSASYHWQFYVNSTTPVDSSIQRHGEITLNLPQKQVNKIWAQLRVSYKYEETSGENKVEKTGYLAGGSESHSRVASHAGNKHLPTENHYLYACPRNNVASSDFWKNGNIAISSGKYIDEHITLDSGSIEGNVEKWMTQLGIWSSWKYQKDYYRKFDEYGKKYVTTVNINDGGQVKVTQPNSGSDIKGDWYNLCADACGVTNVAGLTGNSKAINPYTGEYDPAYATIIKAQHFIDLAKAVTDWT